MNLTVKLISWFLSFTISFAMLTGSVIFLYLKNLFDLPVDIWNLVNDGLKEDNQ